MASVINNIKYILDEENTDPRTRGWFLASSPVQVSLIVAIYLYFSLRGGPKFMEHRKPYELKNTLLVYNAMQVMMSLYLVINGIRALYGQQDYNIYCQPIDHRDTPSTYNVHRMVWWYYIAKLTELLDTVFFVLRKKYNQISFLHVIHHASTPFVSYLGLRFFPNGHGTMFGILNSFIHVIMYTYYLIAGLGPKYQKYLWWKKHVTTMQMIQFTIIILLNFPHIFNSCEYPKSVHILCCLDAALFFYLFGKFYIKSYFKSSKKLSNNEQSDKNYTEHKNSNGRTKLS